MKSSQTGTESADIKSYLGREKEREARRIENVETPSDIAGKSYQEEYDGENRMDASISALEALDAFVGGRDHEG